MAVLVGIALILGACLVSVCIVIITVIYVEYAQKIN